MRKIFANLFLLAVLVVGSLSLAYASTEPWVLLPASDEPTFDEAGPKCTCKYPNTEDYGVACEAEGCCVTDCWIELEVE